MRGSKKSPTVNTKKKGAMEMAKAAAEKVKKNAVKHKGKRPRQVESDDKLEREKKMNRMRLMRKRLGRRRVMQIIFLLKRKYKRLNMRLKLKPKIRFWIPSQT